MRKRSVLMTILSFTAISACVDPAEFNARPFNAELVVGRNYQAVYAGMLQTMRECFRPGTLFFPSPGATTLDAQLYPDLGYGEISTGITGVVPVTHNSVRISKNGVGAKVQIKTANSIESAQGRDQKWLAYWAKGGQLCPRLGALVPPA